MANIHETLDNMINIKKKVEERRKNVHIELEAQSNSSSSLSRNPGPGRTKNDIQVAYGLGFGRSTYPRKANEIIFPIQPVPCQSNLEVDRNRRNNLTYRICHGAASPVFGPKGLVWPRVTRPPPWPPPRRPPFIYIVAVTRLDGFSLDYTVFTVSPLESVCWTPIIRIQLIRSSRECCFSSFLLVFSLHLQELAFSARLIRGNTDL